MRQNLWKYLYRTVDKQGKTVDFLLTAKRDIAAAGSCQGSVALLIKPRDFPGTALHRLNWADHSYQRRKLVCD